MIWRIYCSFCEVFCSWSQRNVLYRQHDKPCVSTMSSPCKELGLGWFTGHRIAREATVI